MKTNNTPKHPSKKIHSKKPHSGKKLGGKNNKKLPPLAFMIFDLSDKSINARIVKITQLIVDNDGETDLTHHYFNNEGHPVSEEAFAHHGVSDEFLKDKPKIESYDFNVAKNIVVWDGQVTRNILHKNGVSKFPSLINLHSLARYLEDVPKPIRLNDYALQANPGNKNMIEFRLKKSENKIHVLPSILKHIEARYLEVYNENSVPFLVTAGKQRNKKGALEAIKAFLDKRETLSKAKGRFKPNKSNDQHKKEAAPAKKVIVVNTSANQAKQGVKTVVIQKRVKK